MEAIEREREKARLKKAEREKEQNEKAQSKAETRERKVEEAKKQIDMSLAVATLPAAPQAGDPPLVRAAAAAPAVVQPAGPAPANGAGTSQPSRASKAAGRNLEEKL